MTPAAAVRFSHIDEANGFVTERISVVKMADEPPEFRAIITPNAGCGIRPRAARAVGIPDGPGMVADWAAPLTIRAITIGGH